MKSKIHEQLKSENRKGLSNTSEYPGKNPQKQKPDPLRYPPNPGPDNPDPEKNNPMKPDKDNDPTVPKPHTKDPLKPDPTKSPMTFI